MSPSQIIAAVETAWAVPAGAVTGPFKIQRTAEARFMAAWLLRVGLGLPLKLVASAINRKEHGTAMNAIDRAKQLMAVDPHFQGHTQRILQLIAGS